MKSLELVRVPTLVTRDFEAVRAFKSAFLEGCEGTPGSMRMFEYNNVQDWVDYCKLRENWSHCDRIGKVPAFVYLSKEADDEKFIGIVTLRFDFGQDKELATIGGNIGQSIAHAYRNQGYGTLQLSSAVDVCWMQGVRKILVTCEVGNIASEATIIKNGFVFESVTEWNGQQFKRFWLEI